MVDKVNHKESLAESPSGELNQPEETGLAISKEITELESRLAQKDEELARANARLLELEQAITSRDSELASLNQSRTELDERLTTVSDALAEAVSSYKAMLVQTNPEIIVELISGDSIEAINESLSQAKTLVTKVRQGVEAEILLAKVPAGAPERTSPDLSALSPREKIQYAIAGQTR